MHFINFFFFSCKQPIPLIYQNLAPLDNDSLLVFSLYPCIPKEFLWTPQFCQDLKVLTFIFPFTNTLSVTNTLNWALLTCHFHQKTHSPFSILEPFFPLILFLPALVFICSLRGHSLDLAIILWRMRFLGLFVSFDHWSLSPSLCDRHANTN